MIYIRHCKDGWWQLSVIINLLLLFEKVAFQGWVGISVFVEIIFDLSTFLFCRRILIRYFS